MFRIDMPSDLCCVIRKDQWQEDREQVVDICR